MPDRERTCPICGGDVEHAGSKHSDFSRRSFQLAHCPRCRFSFVVDPRTDFENLYDEEYYAGRGADPHVRYAEGVDREGSVQEYEWRGVLKVIESLGARPGDRWLDFGCGLGGLVRYGAEHGFEMSGFDEGFAADECRRAGLPILSKAELDERQGTFDVVTAIEVVEHVLDPGEVFAQLASLLRPGGLLFLTTGNAQPYRGRLSSWQYVRPDIHISFYEPTTIETCLRQAGLQSATAQYSGGFTDVIRSKILRTVGVHRRNVVERCMPWPVLARLADRRFGVSRQPVGRRPVD